MTTRRTLRSGYTLLEILIASIIGLLLMAALYAAFALIITDTATGRDLTAESNLSRGIINRVGIDLGSPVGLLPPKSGGSPPAGGGTTPSTGDDTAPTTAATGGETTPTAATPSTDGEVSSAAATTPTTGADLPFQAGVVGTSNQLIIFISRSPEYLRKRGIPFDPALATPADLVKVTYYLHSSGRGLCRQERPWVTSDGVWNSTDPDRTTEDADRIAPEVVNVQFQYADGGGYVSDWDGAAGGTDGSTNKGPPRAVKMTFTLELPVRNADPILKDVSHVFPVRAAAGSGGSTSTATTPTSGTTPTGTTPSTGGGQ